MSYWTTQNSFSRPGKRQFDAINNEIESLKRELYDNDYVLRYELESNVFGELDRAFLAAEMFKNRLLALTESSRSQIVLVQMAASAKNFYTDNHSYNGWNAKRTKYNHGEDNFYDNSNQYTTQNNWNSNNNKYYNSDYAYNRYYNRKNRGNKRKAPKKQILPVNPNTIVVNTGPTAVLKTITPVDTTGSIKNGTVKNTATVKANTAPVKANTAAVKANTAPVKANTAPIKANTGPLKTTVAEVKKTAVVVKPTAAPVTVPTVSVKISSSPVINNTANPAVKTFTAKNCVAVKRNTSGQFIIPGKANSGPVIMPVKTEIKKEQSTPKKIPSLLSKRFKLQFSASDGVNISEDISEQRSNVHIKSEPNFADDIMQDDLENHI